MDRSKIKPVHVCVGDEITPDPFSTNRIINMIACRIEEWDGSEEEAIKLLAKIELLIKNSKLPPIIS